MRVLILSTFLFTLTACQNISSYYADNQAHIKATCHSIYGDAARVSNGKFKRCETEVLNASAQVHNKNWVKAFTITTWINMGIGAIFGFLGAL